MSYRSQCVLNKTMIYELDHEKMSWGTAFPMTVCAPSEDSNQPAHQHSLCNALSG